jgi:soluble lytic murein transglycosylase-like protein
MDYRRAVAAAALFASILVGASPANAGDTLWNRLFGSRDTMSARIIGGARLPVAVPSYLDGVIRQAAAETSIDPNLLAAVIYQESRFDSKAVSRRGAQGLMQLMPRTAKHLGVRNPFDPAENVRGGARYLAEMFAMFNGDLELSLAAYNAGPMAVKAKGPGATKEAVHYVASIKSYYSAAQPRPWLGGATLVAQR